MAYIDIFIVGVFLPLFPLSMVFNVLYARLRHPVMRGLLLFVWPQIGLAALFSLGVTVPKGVLALALLTSLLYALRALALRELGYWISFIGTSSWALLWILLETGVEQFQLQLMSLGISAPLVLLAVLAAGLERRFGAAYTGLYGGLARSIPRYAGVMVVVVLAVVATPLFPTFFAMLTMLIKAAPVMPFIALGVGIVWLLWSWAGARLLQGLIIGPQGNAAVDLGATSLWLFSAVLIGLASTSVYWLGAML
jgi:NADH:ubiquinone oxidoreductase subunit 4 (subunit M)